MGYKIDLSGKKYGRLTVIGFVGNTHRNESIWKCKCDCGNVINVRSNSLKSNHTKSCGCYKAELDDNRKGKPFYSVHGLKNTRLYTAWCNMKSRCYNAKHEYYEYYGGRGIAVCDDWRNDFKKFYDWANENGYGEELTLDRIDTNGMYEPSNCRWVDRYVQANNKRNNFCVPYNGKKYTIHELARMFEIDCSCLRWRIDNGWDIERALHEPSHRKKVV